MLNRIKSTIRDTFIYSLSNIAPKIIGVVLLPLYTKKLLLNEFGNWDLIDNIIQILVGIIILGQASSIIFLNNSKEYKDQKGTTLFTLTLFVFFLCLILVIGTEILAEKYSSFFEHAQIKAEFLRLTSYIVFFKVLNSLFLAKVRAEEESVYYSVVSVAGTLLLMILTIYYVAYYNSGISGILTAAMIVEIITTIVLLVKIIPQIKIRFSKSILTVALKFGIPLVFSAIGFLLLNQSDRFIIKFMLGSKYVALYGLGYRIAGVLNMFLVLPFSLGLLPVAYKYYGQKDDVRFFSKLMTYSTFVFVWGFVFLSLFSQEIVKVFAKKEDFGSVYLLIPIILLSYVFSGMRLTASLGMMLTKNTKHIAWITIAASALNIGLNFIFIPIYGIMAAAVNTLAAFIIFYMITQKLSYKYFKINYENSKLILMILTGSVLSAAIYLLPPINLFVLALIKIFLVILFPVLLYLFDFYEQSELDILLNPSKLIDFINGIIKGVEKPNTESETQIIP